MKFIFSASWVASVRQIEMASSYDLKFNLPLIFTYHGLSFVFLLPNPQRTSIVRLWTCWQIAYFPVKYWTNFTYFVEIALIMPSWRRLRDCQVSDTDARARLLRNLPGEVHLYLQASRYSQTVKTSAPFIYLEVRNSSSLYLGTFNERCIYVFVIITIHCFSRMRM